MEKENPDQDRRINELKEKSKIHIWARESKVDLEKILKDNEMTELRNSFHEFLYMAGEGTLGVDADNVAEIYESKPVQDVFERNKVRHEDFEERYLLEVVFDIANTWKRSISSKN